MMSADKNKQLVLSWLEAGLSGDNKKQLDLTHADFRNYITGRMPISGWHDRATFARNLGMLAELYTGEFTIRIGDLIAEGDRVVIEAEGDTLLTNGTRYNNIYIFIVRIRDGKVAEWKEFPDTLCSYEMLDTEIVRGSSKERESSFENAKHTLRGSA